MLPAICRTCGQRLPGTQLQFVKDYSEKCVVCNSDLDPAVTIHLAVPCSQEEAHPGMKPNRILGPKPVYHKILCNYGPGLPRYLTSSPESATCYHCLSAWKALQNPPSSQEESHTTQNTGS